MEIDDDAIAPAFVRWALRKLVLNNWRMITTVFPGRGMYYSISLPGRQIGLVDVKSHDSPILAERRCYTKAADELLMENPYRWRQFLEDVRVGKDSEERLFKVELHNCQINDPNNLRDLELYR